MGEVTYQLLLMADYDTNSPIEVPQLSPNDTYRKIWCIYFPLRTD